LLNEDPEAAADCFSRDFSINNQKSTISNFSRTFPELAGLKVRK